MEILNHDKAISLFFFFRYVCGYCDTSVIELPFHSKPDFQYDMHCLSIKKYYLNILEMNSFCNSITSGKCRAMFSLKSTTTN